MTATSSKDAWLPRLSLGALSALFLALSIQKIWNVDLWWQLGTGRWILENGAVPSVDFFSYLARGHEWIELRWLFCVLAYSGWQLGGASVLILAQTAVLAATFAILVWPSRRVATDAPVVVLLGLGILAASDRFVVRPELVTFLLIAVYLTVLEGFVRGRHRRAIWALPALQILWANAHTLFVFGPVLAWGFVVGEWARRIIVRRATGDDLPSIARVMVVALAVTAACWINPYFHRGAMFPLVLFEEIQAQSVLGQWIQEFAGPFSMARWPVYLWAAAALTVVSALSFVMVWRRTDGARLLLWLTFAYLATLSVRNVALFALIATWAGVRNWEEASDRLAPRMRARAAPVHVVVSVVLMLLAWYVVTDRYAVAMGSRRHFGLGWVDSSVPRAATAFVIDSGAAPQLYNDMADGSYLIWAGSGRLPVFVDPRLEVYGAELLGRLLAVPRYAWQSPAEWDRFADRNGIATVMLNREYHNTLLTQLQRSPDWVLVHLDSRNIVFVRDVPENADVIRRYRIDLTRPWTPREVGSDDIPIGWRRWIGAVGRPTHSFEMAKTLIGLGSPDNAVPHLEDGLDRFPDHLELRWTLAQTYRSQGRDADAARVMEGIELSPEEEARSERLLGQLLRIEGRPGDAVAAFERAVELQPDHVATLTHLAQLSLEAENYRRAVEVFRRALELESNDAASWISLGRALEHLGDRTPAIDAYRRALTHDPSRYRVHNQLGILLARRGELAEAGRCFENALDLQPDYAPARANLERLRSAR